VPVFEAAGLETVHWTSIGQPTATDREILAYAKLHEYVIFTHDLDFGAILASTNAETPSVIQVRVQDVAPDNLSDCVIAALHQFKELLDIGALITIDDNKTRARILPMNM
jgi:predicted nuclease of predicted toxin-antitoxin system